MSIMTEASTRSILCLMPAEETPGLEAFRRENIHSPGRDVPFHVTLLYRFAPQIDKNVLGRLQDVAASTSRFAFQAKPMSGFPLSRVIYLSPSPAAPIEHLLTSLHGAFPEYHDAEYGLPVLHMTIAMGYPLEEQDLIVKDYLARFGRAPLKLTAGSLAVFMESNGCWQEQLEIPLGG